MSSKLTPPYKILICIIDRTMTNKVLEYLNNVEETTNVTCLAEGTRRLGILQMLGVGSIDRSVIFGFVRTNCASSIIKDIDKMLMYDDIKSFGWVMTTNITSITSDVLEYLALKQDESRKIRLASDAKQATKNLANAKKIDSNEQNNCNITKGN